MRFLHRARALLLLAGVLCATAPAAGQALARTHRAGTAEEYRVTLQVASEITGQQPRREGDRAWVEPLERRAQARVEWTVRRRVLSVDAEGTAVIEETLSRFSGLAAGGAPADEETQQLVAALSGAIGAFAGTDPRTFRYRETASGQLLGLESEGVPRLGESAPPLLTLWLLRALRPTVRLPQREVRIGDRWQEPRSARLENWRDVQGTESGQWMEAADTLEPAVRLHLVQQLAGRVVSGEDKPDRGQAQARFHAESLSSVALADGRLLGAARSATREVTRELDPVPGLEEPPRFTARLSVEVRIEELR